MLLQILTVLPIISICVDGIAPDHESNHAISTQSYHRDDVPLSYKYTSVHIYTTPHPDKKESHQQNYHLGNAKYIQYAPLEQSNYQNNKQRYKHIPEQYESTDAKTTEEHIYQTEENRNSHLEPKVVTENLDVHDQNYRSYVPGHNIEVLQSNRVLGKNDLYRAYHSQIQNQKVDIPKFAIQQNSKNHVQPTLENFRAAEQRPLPEEHNILYTFLPRPILSTPQNAYAVEQPYAYQPLSAKIPRLHLNIARVYGLAHIPQQAPAYINRPNIEKPPSHTQAIFLPLKSPIQQKTILYPVQDTNKNYPVHTLARLY